MREILFRGKRLNDNENDWAYGSYVKQYDCDMIYFPTAESDGFDYAHIIPETVGQYTGLTDKNGTKIFEGDIVQAATVLFRSRPYLVDMDEERGGWFPFACGDGCGCCECEVVRAGCCEVIGNIHDNPELLGGGEGG